MSPVITHGPFNGWSEADASYRTLRRYFGGEPLPVPAPPAPIPPQPPTGELVVEGVITINGQPFILIPKPGV